MKRFLLACVPAIFVVVSTLSFALEMNTGTAVGAAVGAGAVGLATHSLPAAAVGAVAGGVVGTAVHNKNSKHKKK
jgi:outer membrane lipoprotein SlyB